MSYTLLEDLADQIAIPESGLTNKPLLQNEAVRMVGFGIAAGHELKAHTAPGHVLVHFLEGEAEMKLGEETKLVRAGSIVHMQPSLLHAVRAITPVKMIVMILKN
jgi:quercetin dioxygenase-like cupin family protein